MIAYTVLSAFGPKQGIRRTAQANTRDDACCGGGTDDSVQTDS
jgi:hypothetical protein